MIQYIQENVRGLRAYQAPKDYLPVRLDSNESPVNLFELVQEEFIRELKQLTANRYPDSDSTDLREMLSGYTKSEKENILCGNGSDEIIQIIINSFIGKGDRVVIHTPTFSMYKVFANIAGAKVIEVPSSDNFQVNCDDIIIAANKEKAKLIILCNPNNPTGYAIPREDIKNIIEKTDAIVVVDEAYFEFLEETVVDLINTYERLIVLRTMSKAFSLAGARIGYALASRTTIDILNRVKPPYNLNIFSQLIGKLYLKNLDLVTESIMIIKTQRKKLYDELLKFKTLQPFPSSANFILVKSDKSLEIMNTSLEEGISLRDYEKTDPLLQNCLRVTVGTEAENEKLINVFRKVVD